MLAASVPDTGVASSLIRFEFMSMWSPTWISPDDVFSSPSSAIPFDDDSCRTPVPEVATFRF